MCVQQQSRNLRRQHRQAAGAQGAGKDRAAAPVQAGGQAGQGKADFRQPAPGAERDPAL